MKFSGTLLISSRRKTQNGFHLTKAHMDEGNLDCKTKVKIRTITFFEGDAVENGPTDIHDLNIGTKIAVENMKVHIYNYWANCEKTHRKQILRAG